MWSLSVPPRFFWVAFSKKGASEAQGVVCPAQRLRAKTGGGGGGGGPMFMGYTYTLSQISVISRFPNFQKQPRQARSPKKTTSQTDVFGQTTSAPT